MDGLNDGVDVGLEEHPDCLDDECQGDGDETPRGSPFDSPQHATTPLKDLIDAQSKEESLSQSPRDHRPCALKGMEEKGGDLSLPLGSSQPQVANLRSIRVGHLASSADVSRDPRDESGGSDVGVGVCIENESGGSDVGVGVCIENESGRSDVAVPALNGDEDEALAKRLWEEDMQHVQAQDALLAQMLSDDYNDVDVSALALADEGTFACGGVVPTAPELTRDQQVPADQPPRRRARTTMWRSAVSLLSSLEDGDEVAVSGKHVCCCWLSVLHLWSALTLLHDSVRRCGSENKIGTRHGPKWRRPERSKGCEAEPQAFSTRTEGQYPE